MSPIEVREFTVEELLWLTDRMQMNVSEKEKIIYFSPKGNVDAFPAISFYIRNQKNFLFPFVVIEDMELSRVLMVKLDSLFQNDSRVEKLMLNRVTFKEGAGKAFSLLHKTIKHLIFANCKMSKEDEAYLRGKRKPGEILVTVV